jgi:hypothetical protein
MKIKNNIGWMQCTQCGNGFEVTKQEVDCGDYVDRQACDCCGIGPMIIDWTYPDGAGWTAAPAAHVADGPGYINLPENPEINMNNDSSNNRKQAIINWMTRGNMKHFSVEKK